MGGSGGWWCGGWWSGGWRGRGAGYGVFCGYARLAEMDLLGVFFWWGRGWGGGGDGGLGKGGRRGDGGKYSCGAGGEEEGGVFEEGLGGGEVGHCFVLFCLVFGVWWFWFRGVCRGRRSFREF